MKKIFREIFSEPSGMLSWGRVASAIALVAGLGWVTHIVISTHSLPALDGITAFVLGPYGANKVATAVQAFAGKDGPQQ